MRVREETAGVLDSRRCPLSFYASCGGPCTLGVFALALKHVKGGQAVGFRHYNYNSNDHPDVAVGTGAERGARRLRLGSAVWVVLAWM